jgi:tripartite-type tricarboxylate transporter receptor subunit TctC
MRAAQIRFAVIFLPAALAALSAAPKTQAQDFYAGKSIRVITSTGSGGTYDIIARMAARHLPKYIPGAPSVVVQNMPGGGHMLASNHIYNLAAKDGTVLGVLNQNVPAHQVLNGRGVRYDARKFNWLASLGDRNQLFVTWHSSGLKTFEDVLKKGAIAGATGEGSSGFRYPTAINNVLGANIKIVKGYKNAGDVELAMSRGEVNSQAHSYTAYLTGHADWIREKKINFVLQMGPKRDRDLPDVPLWTDFAKTPEDKAVLNLIGSSVAIGRPFLAPPGVPADRVALLRKAFLATFADKTFIAEAEKQHIDVEVLTGEELQQIVDEIVGASPAVIARAKIAMGVKERK